MFRSRLAQSIFRAATGFMDSASSSSSSSWSAFQNIGATLPSTSSRSFITMQERWLGAMGSLRRSLGLLGGAADELQGRVLAAQQVRWGSMTKMQLWRGKRKHNFRVLELRRERQRKITLKSATPSRGDAPFRKGVVVRVFTMAPKKPNSARRKVAKVRVREVGDLLCYIPGEGHNLQEHSVVLIRGGRCQDLPGLKFEIVRGWGDLAPVKGRKTERSRYGGKLDSKA